MKEDIKMKKKRKKNNQIIYMGRVILNVLAKMVTWTIRRRIFPLPVVTRMIHNLKRYGSTLTRNIKAWNPSWKAKWGMKKKKEKVLLLGLYTFFSVNLLKNWMIFFSVGNHVINSLRKSNGNVALSILNNR